MGTIVILPPLLEVRPQTISLQGGAVDTEFFARTRDGDDRKLEANYSLEPPEAQEYRLVGDTSLRNQDCGQVLRAYPKRLSIERIPGQPVTFSNLRLRATIHDSVSGDAEVVFGAVSVVKNQFIAAIKSLFTG